MDHIALCDDELPELNKIENLLGIYKNVYPESDLAVQQFTAIEPLLAEIEQGRSYDILLLDIYLSDKTGIQAAKELRWQGNECPIIFLTTSVEHALDAFAVDAVQYLLKPVEQRQFFSAMDKALDRAERERRRYITLRLDGVLQRIALRDIVFCESHGNYQYPTLVDGTELRVRMTLTELRTLMANSSDFVAVGSAYLVNLRHVASVSAKEILLDNGRRIGVARGAYAALKQEYFEFYCSGKDKASG